MKGGEKVFKWFTSDYGEDVWVNPNNVTHILPYDEKTTFIYFNTANEKKQHSILVKGNIDTVVEKLSI